jgi:hypothetical protein
MNFSAVPPADLGGHRLGEPVEQRARPLGIVALVDCARRAGLIAADASAALEKDVLRKKPRRASEKSLMPTCEGPLMMSRRSPEERRDDWKHFGFASGSPAAADGLGPRLGLRRTARSISGSG